MLLLARVFALPGHADPPRGFGEWLETERMQSGVPRASVAVIRNFGVAWAAGYGLADIVRGVQVTFAKAPIEPFRGIARRPPAAVAFEL